MANRQESHLRCPARRVDLKEGSGALQQDQFSFRFFCLQQAQYHLSLQPNPQNVRCFLEGFLHFPRFDQHLFIKRSGIWSSPKTTPGLGSEGLVLLGSKVSLPSRGSLGASKRWFLAFLLSQLCQTQLTIVDSRFSLCFLFCSTHLMIRFPLNVLLSLLGSKLELGRTRLVRLVGSTLVA